MFFSDCTYMTPEVCFILCPLVFLAGFLDAIAGGGALISIPAYLLAGIPIHTAIATNKLSATFGASISAFRFMKNRYINFQLGLPSVAFAMAGSIIGAHLSMSLSEKIMLQLLLILLPVTALIVLNKNLFHDTPNQKLLLNARTISVVMTVAFFIGMYDGFFGPGAGTFTIICFTVLGKMSIVNANAQTKLINLTTTVTALVVFLLNGQVAIPLGITAGLCNLLGSYLGAGLAMTKGTYITKPALLLVLTLLAVKLTGGF